MEAIRIIGSQVMQPRGLIGLGFDTIDHSGSEIAEVHSSLPSPILRAYPMARPIPTFPLTQTM